MTFATSFLGELLRHHDVPCREEGEWLRLSPQGPRVLAKFTDARTFPNHHSVRLQVCFELWTGRSLEESFAGFGLTGEQAERDAFQNFGVGALHVLVGAFLRPPDSRVTEEEWEIAGVRRRVTLGPLTDRGAQLPDDVSRAWREEIQRRIQAG